MTKDVNDDRILDRLFPDVGSERFVREHYASTPLIVHGPRARFGLEDEPALFSPGPLFEKKVSGKPDDILNGYLRKPDGKSFHIRIQADAAKAVFNFGGTVELDGILDSFANLRALVEGLRGEVGGSKGKAVILVSPPGEALPMHFDQQDVFILQLSGRKRWRIAKNTSIEHPLDSYFPQVRGEGRDNAIWPAYFPATLPTSTSPEETVDVVLEPGSVAYVPRGYWHATEALETSISVTIISTPVAFVNLFLDRMRDLLMRDPEMRRPVVLPFDAKRREQTRDEMGGLIRRALELGSDLTSDALVSTPFPQRKFKRAPGHSLSLTVEDETVNIARIAQDGETVCEVEIEHDAVSLCKWIAERESFNGLETTQAAGRDVLLAESLIEALTEAGYLVR